MYSNFWRVSIRYILRYRVLNLIIIGLATVLMLFQASRVQMSYELAQMLPSNDSISIDYENFKKTFGQDGSVMFVAFQDPDIFDLDHFNGLFELTESLKMEPGVEEVVSLSRMYSLEKIDSLKTFDFKRLVKNKPSSQQELDSIRKAIYNLPFYEGLLFNTKSSVYLMMITLDEQMLNTEKRVGLVYDLRDQVNQYVKQTGAKVYFSGLPYIRTVTSKKIQDEMLLFVILSIIISSLILWMFFRSKKAVVFTMFIVAISVVFVLGTISLLGYKITILMGILPPLLIVIGVENSIFLLNKYHTEFLMHGNKAKSLSRMIARIGNANLLTNTTTAAGFAAFIVTGNRILVEFGIVASINILIAYLLSLFLIPILYSYLGVPKSRHTRHLESGKVSRVLNQIIHIVSHHRNKVYWITLLAILIGIGGIVQLKTTGNIVDDISKGDVLYKDLLFLEEHFKGVMPFEISIDTKKRKGLLQMKTLQKIEQLQDSLAAYQEFSRPVSIAEILKFARQAYYNGHKNFYGLPDNQEKNFILRYLPKSQPGRRSILDAFVDSNLQITRISIQMANIGTNDIERIKNELEPKIKSIFPSSDYEVRLTGTSVVFLAGTNYLVKNLLSSLLLALVIIGMLMAIIFSSARMIIISLIPNLIPQLMTAGMMGYFNISIKPSTILIFSIALGISVDNAIHFLSRYRLHLKMNEWKINISVIDALRETGFSMIYSATVLFFGFAIFTLSSFGGTQAMGYLVTFTLVIAVLSNLFLLPSLLLSLDRRITTKSFKEPLLVLFDEEEDIELDELQIEMKVQDDASTRAGLNEPPEIIE